MHLQQVILKVDHLLRHLVLSLLSVCIRPLQPPYIHPIGCVCPYAAIEVAPCIAMGIMVVRNSQIASDVSAVNL